MRFVAGLRHLVHDSSSEEDKMHQPYADAKAHSKRSHQDRPVMAETPQPPIWSQTHDGTKLQSPAWSVLSVAWR